jgi:homopolymeric O-antigen transport system permease protein
VTTSQIESVQSKHEAYEKARAPLSNSPLVRIEASQSWFTFDLKELWEYRELLYFLAWRDIKVRYKQTGLGIAWAVLQPMITMLLFTGIFGKLAHVPSDGLPYPIFAFTALLPWNYFSGALTISTNSVVMNSNLISKVYFPRLIVPLSGVVSGFVDFGVALVVLFGMMYWFGIAPTWGVLLLPCFLLLATATALGVGLWLSALNARYRDIGYLIPFLIQCWMYASPVAYPVSLVPEKWRLLYSLNPMVGVIEGFRWGLLGKEPPAAGVMAVSILAVIALLFGGVCFFKRMERTFADIV